jgi:hypothetical protein
MSELAWARAELSHGHILLLQSTHVDDPDEKGLYKTQAYRQLTTGLGMLADAVGSEGKP